MEPCSSFLSRLEPILQLLYLPRLLFSIPLLLLIQLVQFRFYSRAAKPFPSRQTHFAECSAANRFATTKDTCKVETVQICPLPSLSTLRGSACFLALRTMSSTRCSRNDSAEPTTTFLSPKSLVPSLCTMMFVAVFVGAYSFYFSSMQALYADQHVTITTAMGGCSLIKVILASFSLELSKSEL